MSIQKFTASVAVAALLMGAALSGQAQTTQPAEAEAQAEATQVQNLPEVLLKLNLQDLREEPARKGMRRITGTTAEGEELRSMISEDGTLKGVSGGDSPLPAALVEELLPQALRDDQVYKQFSSVMSFGLHKDMVALRGIDANDEKVFALFASDGRLMRFGRGEPMGFKGMKHSGKHRHEHGKMHGKMHGKHHHEGDAPSPDGQPQTPPFDAGAVNQKLTEAGYSAFGFLYKSGPKILLDAVNPQKEPVTLQLDPEGEIVREQRR